MQYFTITEQHLKLLQRMNVDWNGAYYGAPTIDVKRPYGNGDAVDDILGILDMGRLVLDETYPMVLDGILKLHQETKLALQICLATQSFEPGDYVAHDYTNDWKQE